MSCNVIVQLVSLTFIVMFSSVFAQKNIDEEGINERIIRSLPDDETIPNRTSGGDTNTQRDMPREYCFESISGWRSVMNIDANYGECPNNFIIAYMPNGIRVCRSNITAPDLYGVPRTHRVNYSINSNVPFTNVVGFVQGYQFGSPDAFHRSWTQGGLDGIIFSYGNSTNDYFLWAYAAGLADKRDRYACPCSTVQGDPAPSEFGKFFYCDTGNSGDSSERRWFTEKVLWSREGCPATSTCCNDPNLPYFCRTELDVQKTSNADQFAITMMFSDAALNEDIGITKLEIYIS